MILLLFVLFVVGVTRSMSGDVIYIIEGPDMDSVIVNDDAYYRVLSEKDKTADL